MAAKRKSDQRRGDRGLSQHRIIARYDFGARRWVHSAGVMLTPRESSLLEGLAKGITTREVAEACGMRPATFFNAQTRLKHYFGIPLKTQQGQHQLVKIAMDLYGGHWIGETPHGKPRGATCMGKVS